MQHLPVHPLTGLRAVGIVGGRPVWPILGGSGDTPPPSAPPAGQPTPVPAPSAPADPPKPTDPKAGDPPKDPNAPLGEGGIKALQAEREARKALEKKLEGLAPLEKLAAALGASGDPATGPTEIEQITERLSSYETELKTEREARWRAEVANAKKLTPEQALELRGATQEELAAHADRLLTLFPSVPQPPGTPRPDPSQGGQGGSGVNLDSQIAEAQKKGDWRTAMSLQNQKLTNQ